MSELSGIFVCEECGSENVEQLMWVDINSDVILDGTGDTDASNYWCRDCSEHTTIMDKNEFNKLVDGE